MYLEVPHCYYSYIYDKLLDFWVFPIKKNFKHLNITEKIIIRKNRLNLLKIMWLIEGLPEIKRRINRIVRTIM